VHLRGFHQPTLSFLGIGDVQYTLQPPVPTTNDRRDSPSAPGPTDPFDLAGARLQDIPKTRDESSKQVKCSIMEADCFSARKQRRLVSSLNRWPISGSSTLLLMGSPATTTFVTRSGPVPFAGEEPVPDQIGSPSSAQWIRLRFAPFLKSAIIGNQQSPIAISWAGFRNGRRRERHRLHSSTETRGSASTAEQ
jgi:hypothetical protein